MLLKYANEASIQRIITSRQSLESCSFAQRKHKTLDIQFCSQMHGTESQTLLLNHGIKVTYECELY